MPILKPLKHIRPHRIPFRHMAQRSAVAIITRQGTLGEEILLIKRATRIGDPWSGHIAFPGGKQQTSDGSTLNTAIRETQEEIGLDLSRNANLLGRSPDLITRRHNTLKPMVVTPYRFQLNYPDIPLQPNHEVATTLWVPVSFLRNKRNQSTLKWSPLSNLKRKPAPINWLQSSLSLQLPCYYFQNHCIWGLTYQMLSDLLHFSKVTEK